MKCSFCCLVFDEKEARHQCQACLLAGGCRSVRCPRCGYEMPEELGLLKRLRAWRERRRARRTAGAGAMGSDTAEPALSENAVSLAEMRPGQSGVVVDLRSDGASNAQKCLALGILPGATITLRKSSPSYIFDLGFSRFAVDRGIASTVMIRLRQR